MKRRECVLTTAPLTLAVIVLTAFSCLYWAPGAAAQPEPAPTFAPAVVYQTGAGIPSNVGTSVAVGDINGDAIPDLVTANFGPDSLSIFIGDGTGAFGARTDIVTGRFHSGVALGDLDGDADLDIVATDVGGNAVSIFLGDGAGGFGPGTDFGIFCPKSVAIADLNHDGRLDLAVSTSCGGTFGGVFLGTGGGDFASPIFFATGGSTGVDPNNRSIAITDMDGDANQDLVVANRFTSNVTVLLGDGAGNFPAPTLYPAGNGSFSLAVGDLDGDGDSDVVTANSFGGDISVLLGDGAGGLGAPTNYATPSGATAIGIADLNGDGNLDLAVGGGFDAGGGTVSVYLGDGAGGFGPRFDFGTVFSFGGSFDLAVRDLNGDGKPDLAVASASSNQVAILLNTTPFGPGPPATLTLEPDMATNPVDSEHCVTATVTDADGTPVPEITVRFSVSGSDSTSGAATTDANGQATFCYTVSALPGEDAIHAYADTDGDEVQDPGEPFDDATKVIVLPESTPDCSVSNGGRITAANGDKATFGGNAAYDGVAVSGDEQYVDHGPAANVNVDSTVVLAVVCSDDRTQASIFGEATINGLGSHSYRIDVTDLGKIDTYRIRLDTGYDSGAQTLKGGNVRIA